MKKTDAIAFFGDERATSIAVGITIQAVNKWPDNLPRRIVDRIIAALIRQGRNSDARRAAGTPDGRMAQGKRMLEGLE